MNDASEVAHQEIVSDQVGVESQTSPEPVLTDSGNSRKGLFKKHNVFLALLIVVLFGVVAVGGYVGAHYAMHGSFEGLYQNSPWFRGASVGMENDVAEKPVDLTSEVTTAADTSRATASPTPVALSVEYHEREIAYEWQMPSEEFEGFEDQFVVYAVGEVTGEPFVGATVYLVEVFLGGPCKGPGCGLPQFARLLQVDERWIALPHNSRVALLDQAGFVELALGVGYEMEANAAVALTQVQYPQAIEGSSEERRLVFAEEFTGALDTTQLELAFEHPAYGPIYTTQPELYIEEAFLSDDVPEDAALTGSFGRVCPGEGCYLTGSFFWPRPDGTMVRFSYEPPFGEESFQTEVEYGQATYRYTTSLGCSGGTFDDVAVMRPSTLSQNDLVEEGSLESGEKVFALQDKEHMLVQQFYESYKQIDPMWRYQDAEAHPVTFETFAASRPMLFWQDAFGRWVRLSNTEFLPPVACEPIVYMYPPVPQSVQVGLGSDIWITASTPVYGDGWDVWAEPSGQLIDARDGVVYDSLFWEGYSGFLPPLYRGEVVARGEVPVFLQETLWRLGLNESEIEDFLAAWETELSQAPYYLISFYNQAVIEAVYPLEVQPKPDTVIRVLMSYEPLKEPVSIVPLVLPEKRPERNGFSVVEWGGVEGGEFVVAK